MPRLRHTVPLLTLSLLACALLTARAGEAEDAAAADEKLLTERGVKTDGPSLLTFLRERSLNEEERGQMKELVKQLGDSDFEKREAASQKFITRGRVSLPFLKAVLDDKDPEVARRAQAA